MKYLFGEHNFFHCQKIDKAKSCKFHTIKNLTSYPFLLDFVKIEFETFFQNQVARNLIFSILLTLL